MDGKLIVGCDPGIGSDSTAIAVVMYDEQTGVSTMMSMHQTRFNALQAMKEMHNRHRVPYHFAVGKDGKLTSIKTLFDKPKTVLELMRRCKRV